VPRVLGERGAGWKLLVTLFFVLVLMPCGASALSVAFSSASDVPITAAGFTAAGQPLDVTLNFAPVQGTTLTVVKNTASSAISGTFTNVSQGDGVALTYSGHTYQFVLSYFGGTGNDIVLLWPGTTAYAWGSNFSGQLGDGTTDDAALPVAVLRTGVFAESTLTGLTGAGFHTLALAHDGKIYGWGYNGDGELGDGSVGDKLLAAPTYMDAFAGKTVIAVAHGGLHSLALTSDGSAYAWGYNGTGQLGDGTANDHSIPTAVDSSGVLTGKVLVAVSGADDHSIALADDGTVYSWGRNDFGQLGDGTNTQRLSPVAVGGVLAGKTVVAISGGHAHSLALTSNGDVYAWGYNQNGQLGNGSTAPSNVPVPVTMTGVLAGKTVIAIAAGGDHNVVLASDGHVYAWGRDDYGQLGDDSTAQSNVPVAVDTTGPLGGKTIVAVAAGHSHSLALASNGALYAWGNNSQGQLGDGTTSNRPSPVAVDMTGALSGKTVTSITCGGSHTLVLAAATQAPDISVDQPPGNSLVDAVSAVDFGSAPAGSSVTRTFTIRNTGSADLTGLAITKTGADSGDFTITPPSVTALAANASTNFTIVFSSGGFGARAAAIHISSNDPDESPFDIDLTGSGLSESELWRQSWFGTPFNAGTAADNADPDHDGIINFIEFATSRNPTSMSAPVGSLARSGENLQYTYTCNKSAISDGVLFAVEWADSLPAGPWSTAGVTTTVIDHTTTQTVIATLPSGSSGYRFVRLRIQRP